MLLDRRPLSRRGLPRGRRYQIHGRRRSKSHTSNTCAQSSCRLHGCLCVCIQKTRQTCREMSTHDTFNSHTVEVTVTYGKEPIWFSKNDPPAPSAVPGIPVPFFFGRCFFCKQLGHSQKWCPLRQCVLCNEFGHPTDACPTRQYNTRVPAASRTHAKGSAASVGKAPDLRRVPNESRIGNI